MRTADTTTTVNVAAQTPTPDHAAIKTNDGHTVALRSLSVVICESTSLKRLAQALSPGGRT